MGCGVLLTFELLDAGGVFAEELVFALEFGGQVGRGGGGGLLAGAEGGLELSYLAVFGEELAVELVNELFEVSVGGARCGGTRACEACFELSDAGVAASEERFLVFDSLLHFGDFLGEVGEAGAGSGLGGSGSGGGRLECVEFLFQLSIFLAQGGDLGIECLAGGGEADAALSFGELLTEADELLSVLLDGAF